MRRRVDEPLDEDWKQVVVSFRDELTTELKTGRADPGAQLSAAKLLELLTLRARGRPAQRIGSAKNWGIASAIDEVAAIYADRGYTEAAAIRAARRDFKTAESSLSLETIRDYHRKGITEMGDGNARLAMQIDETAKRLAKEGYNDPFGVAVAQAARRHGQFEFVTRLNYRRGKKRLAKRGN